MDQLDKSEFKKFIEDLSEIEPSFVDFANCEFANGGKQPSQQAKWKKGGGVNTRSNKKSSVKDQVSFDSTELSQVEFSNRVLYNVFNMVKNMNAKLDEVNSNLHEVRSELKSAHVEIANLKKSNEAYKKKILSLSSENETLYTKLDTCEKGIRSCCLLVSGPRIRYDLDATELQLLDTSIEAIKSTYNFDLKKDDVTECRRFGAKDNSQQSILIKLRNKFIKDDILSSVISKDKREGVDVSVNEFLSSHNSLLFYKVRQLKKKHKQKIYTTFTRNGTVFYKLKKDSQAKIITCLNDFTQLCKQLSVPVPK